MTFADATQVVARGSHAHVAMTDQHLHLARAIAVLLDDAAHPEAAIAAADALAVLLARLRQERDRRRRELEALVVCAEELERVA